MRYHTIHSPKELLAQLTAQCAPVICAVKSANLLHVSREYEQILEESFPWAGMELKCLVRNKNRDTFFVYRRDILKEIMFKKEVFDFLKERGYDIGEGLDTLLDEIAKRYENHIQNRSEFPHELGILLGYPLCDVQGFIKNNGQNFLYCGYWKVYQNLEDALWTFQQYARAEQRLKNIPIMKRTLS